MLFSYHIHLFMCGHHLGPAPSEKRKTSLALDNIMST